MGMPGVMQLDRFHLWRALRSALWGQETVAGQVYQEATQGCWEKVEALLGAFLTQPGLSPERHEAVASVYHYMAANREGLSDWRRRVRCQPGDRSLGAMEGNVDKLIAIRTKRRGMSWRKRGLHAMAKLLQSIHEGEVDTYASPCRCRPATQPPPSRRWERRTRGQAAPLQAALPALRGPHASRPWARRLKALSTPILN